ncbi:leucine-rich repeat-containing protein 15-like isoform X1 [Dreissena polymorpha]|uniref:leucine-rich repeat-containing protein 15-like isoform X1 n=1 Tax=Dreissena polymorpha TaxID=45954 RepID=UPI00226538FC|nr:leucine-rich repeat-containing protein 15-like isoform X1 [Dreissena polymorpha]XP_052225623.1 leucine-rich repeat-containing protein 15-like isoform X1 [Dreissena polymorpha]
MASGCSDTVISTNQLITYCDYPLWSPPLLDSQFSTSPGKIELRNINGDIPSQAFSGLYNTGGFSGIPQISLDCGFTETQRLTLHNDSLTPNLVWVESMLITFCVSMVIEDSAFAAMTGLQKLSILGGNFSSISPTAFAGMTNLTTLELLSDIPAGLPVGLFDDLTELKILDMSDAKINSLPAGVFNNLKQLETLKLIGNGLTSLPERALLPLLSLTSLSLENNAWTCDCDLQWLGSFLYDTGLATAKCGSPAAFAGFDLSRSLASLTCVPTTTTTTTVTTATTRTAAALTTVAAIAQETSADDKWWRYGIAGGASLALVVALVALGGCCYYRNQISDLKRKAIDTGPLHATTLANNTYATPKKSEPRPKVNTVSGVTTVGKQPPPYTGSQLAAKVIPATQTRRHNAWDNYPTTMNEW